MNETVRMIPVRGETLRELELGAELTGQSIEDFSEKALAAGISPAISPAFVGPGGEFRLLSPQQQIAMLKLALLHNAKRLREEGRRETRSEKTIRIASERIVADAEKQSAP